jgi:hypothetical protein
VIHTASPNDATSHALDTAFLDTVLPTPGRKRPAAAAHRRQLDPRLRTPIDEDTPVDPPPIVAWRLAVLDRVRAAASDGIRTVVTGPANLYGDGAGIPAMLASGSSTPSGARTRSTARRFSGWWRRLVGSWSPSRRWRRV